MQHINYRENWQRGTADFPLEFHHISNSHPQYIMSYHWHVEFEIIRIISGSFLFSLDNQEAEVNAGSVLIIPAGSVHSGIPTDCVYECIVMDLNFLINKSDSCARQIKQIMNHEIQLQSIFSDSYDNIHQITWNLFHAIGTKNDGYELIVLGSLYQLFGTFFSSHTYTVTSSQTSLGHKRIRQLKQVLEYIETAYTTHVSLEEIAESVHMSPKYFCRFFQEMTHRTPIDYLNYYRIERACYQLLTSDQSITEVAYSVGFNDLSYFIKTFKKYKGTTPKKYLA